MLGKMKASKSQQDIAVDSVEQLNFFIPIQLIDVISEKSVGYIEIVNQPESVTQ
jgi:hypothetical protein